MEPMLGWASAKKLSFQEVMFEKNLKNEVIYFGKEEREGGWGGRRAKKKREEKKEKNQDKFLLFFGEIRY